MNEKDDLLTQIKYLEEQAKPLDSTEEERSLLLNAVNNYTEDFLKSLPSQKTYEVAGYEKQKGDAFFEIDDESSGIDCLLSFITKRVDKPGLNPPSGGHFAYIPAGGLYASALADFIAAVSNRYAGVFFASPGAVRTENALIRWAGRLVGYTGDFGGNLTSGGSLANMIAVAAARDTRNIKARDVEISVIYTCSQAHHSLIKALKVTGLGECIVRMIDTDEHYRMDMRHLKKQIDEDKRAGLKPFLLFGNAGSTDTGAIDPLEEMATISSTYGLWFHVDAAYGGFFLLLEEGRKKMKGIHLADSVILDPHKGLFIPYGSGIVLVKNVRHLLAANSYDAHYMQDAQGADYEYSPTDLSPEMSKHFRGLRMWIPLKLYGTKPFVSSLEEKLLLTRYFYEEVRKLGFHTGPYPDLSVVVFWYVPAQGDANAYNKGIMESIKQDGRVFISTTTIDGQFVLRFVALSFRTHIEQVDILLQILRDHRKQNS